jgi:hypothetical protein
VTALISSVEQKIFPERCHAAGTKKLSNTAFNLNNLLADPPEDVKKRKSNRRLFRQLPSHAKAANKILKVFSLVNGSWVWARIAQTLPIITSKKQAFLFLS